MIRDLTDAQFQAALTRHGITPEGFMGYYNLGVPGHHVSASVLNLSRNASKRIRLAYLLQKRDAYIAEIEHKLAMREATL